MAAMRFGGGDGESLAARAAGGAVLAEGVDPGEAVGLVGLAGRGPGGTGGTG
jgi:hypothetical protein